MEITPSTNRAPTVSIVIPFYNRIDAVRQSLNSIREQTFEDWEIIVVDDASDVDPTASLVAIVPDKLRVLRLERNVGPSEARNRGVDLARGQFVAFLDSDDYWKPTKLEKQIEAILAFENPFAAVCTTKVLVVGGARTEIRPQRAICSGEDMGEYLFLQGGFGQTSSLLLSKSAAARIRFDGRLRQFEDYLFLIQAQAAGFHLLLVDEVLTVWANDERPGRLSKSAHKNMRNIEIFVDAARKVITERALISFQVKKVGEIYARQAPLEALRLLRGAYAHGIVSRLEASKIFLGAHLPRTIRSRIRQLKERYL